MVESIGGKMENIKKNPIFLRNMVPRVSLRQEGRLPRHAAGLFGGKVSARFPRVAGTWDFAAATRAPFQRSHFVGRDTACRGALRATPSRHATGLIFRIFSLIPRVCLS